MTRHRRTSELLLSLEVVMEEDSPLSTDNTVVADSCLTRSQQPNQKTTTCAVTLRTSDEPGGGEPQFLHGGKWPSVDTSDEVAGSAAQSVGGLRQCRSHVSTRAAGHRAAPGHASSSVMTNTWQAVTPEQLSMAVDYWDPDEQHSPRLKTLTAAKAHSSTGQPMSRKSTVPNQQQLFLREVRDEFLTRLDTVEHIEELDDNDDAIEIVATLEQYRQDGWADEMIKAFPGECYQFWISSGLNATKKAGSLLEDSGFAVLGSYK